MEIERLTYLSYLLSDEEKKIELQTIYSYLDYKIDCKTWSYGKVKECQYLLSKPITHQTVIDIVGMQIDQPILALDAHIVLATFNGIVKSISEISEIENNANGHVASGNELIASEEVGGFAVFGYLPELDRLAMGDILKYEAIKKLSWEECFNKLTYDVRQAKYNDKLMKLEYGKKENT